MKLSLKNARKLETAIEKVVKQGVTTSVKVRVKAPSKESFELKIEAKNKAMDSIEDMMSLNKVRFELRRKIEVANETKKLNENMNKKAQLTSDVAFLKDCLSGSHCSKEEFFDIIEKHQKMMDGSEVPSYRKASNMVSVQIPSLDEDSVKAMEADVVEMQKSLKKIDEVLSDLNHSVKVDLDAESVSLLEKYNLV